MNEVIQHLYLRAAFLALWAVLVALTLATASA